MKQLKLMVLGTLLFAFACSPDNSAEIERLEKEKQELLAKLKQQELDKIWWEAEAKRMKEEHKKSLEDAQKELEKAIKEALEKEKNNNPLIKKVEDDKKNGTVTYNEAGEQIVRLTPYQIAEVLFTQMKAIGPIDDWQVEKLTKNLNDRQFTEVINAFSVKPYNPHYYIGEHFPNDEDKHADLITWLKAEMTKEGFERLKAKFPTVYMGIKEKNNLLIVSQNFFCCYGQL